jgi:GT2 family glycosyltransferase
MISVVIPSYNSAHTISDCLYSLEGQTYSGDVEIIVVDSSADGNVETVATRYPDVQLIRLTPKTDPGTARNIGIGKAKGDLIAFIDADCVAASDWLARMAVAHESSYMAVGGIVKNSPGSANLVGCAGYLAEFRDFLPGVDRQEVMHIPTCNISYKSQVFSEYGLFDGKFYPQEDLLFNHRLYQRGEKILLDPDIQVCHRHRTRLRDFLCHQRRIGKATSKVLRDMPLEGSFLAKRRLLAGCTAPLITLVKFARTIRVFSTYEPGFIKERPMVLPIFVLGLVSWAIGFVESTFPKEAKTFGTKEL